MKLTLPFLPASTMAKRGRIAGARNRRHSTEGERQGRIPAAGVLQEPQQSPRLHQQPAAGIPVEADRPASERCTAQPTSS